MGKLHFVTRLRSRISLYGTILLLLIPHTVGGVTDAQRTNTNTTITHAYVLVRPPFATSRPRVDMVEAVQRKERAKFYGYYAKDYNSRLIGHGTFLRTSISTAQHHTTLV
jgi:hypothetical protein